METLISSWIGVIPAACVALCLLTIPGFLVVMAARARLFTAVGLSGPVSATIVAVSGVAAPHLGLGWDVLTVSFGTVIAAAVSFVVGLIIARSTVVRSIDCKATRKSENVPEQTGRKLLPGAVRREAVSFGAVALAACFIGFRFLQIFQRPEFLSQTADNIFHLNVVRYIQENDEGSILTAGGVQGNGPEFYPAVWHSAVALVADTAQVGIPEAANCVNIAIGCVLWPIGAVFLARVLFGSKALLLLSTGVAASAFSAYPYLLVDWGVLYPNFYAMAFVLPALAAATRVFGRNARGTDRKQISTHIWLLLLVIPGLTLAHPNALLVFIVAVLPLVLGAYVRCGVRLFVQQHARARLGKTALFAGVGLLGVMGLAVAWVGLRPLPLGDFANTWQPYQTTAQAIGEVLLTTHAGRNAAWATAVLVLVGVVSLLRERESRWYIVSYLLVASLFVFASGVENSPARTFLTGGWYDDQNRLAAGAAILAVPLAAQGMVVAARSLTHGLQRLRVPIRPAVTVASLIVLGTTFVVSQDTAVRPSVQKAMKAYSLGPNSDIMSTNELELYQQIEELVPEEAVVAGNPWDGSAWVYMVTGRTVVFPHVQTLMTEDRAIVAASLNRAYFDPQVCQAVDDLGIEYAVTSEELIYLPGNPANEMYPGITGLDEAPGFEKVAEVGQVELFRITACD